jgi:hypothetical protein
VKFIILILLSLNLFPILFGKVVFERLLSIDGKVYTKEEAQEQINLRKNPKSVGGGYWNLGYATDWLYAQHWGKIIRDQSQLKLLIDQNSNSKLKILDNKWSKVLKQFETLEESESLAKQEENWIRNLPSFDSVSKRAKESAKKFDKLILMKTLHIWQSLEDAFVAVREIANERDVKLTTVYPFSILSKYSFRKPIKISVSEGKTPLLVIKNLNYAEINKLMNYPTDLMKSISNRMMLKLIKNLDNAPNLVESDIENTVDTIVWTLEGIIKLFPLDRSLNINSFRELVEKKYVINFKKTKLYNYVRTPHRGSYVALTYNSSITLCGDQILLTKTYKNTRFDPKVQKGKLESKTIKNQLNSFD